MGKIGCVTLGASLIEEAAPWPSGQFSSSCWASSTGVPRRDRRRAGASEGERRGARDRHLSNLSKDEAIELGSKVGALVGLGIEGEEGLYAGAEAGAEAAADGISAVSDEDAWDVIEEIPNDSAAALILLEHHWAVPLRDAIVRAGGYRVTDGFISPLDLVEIGLLSSEEAQELHSAETRRQPA